LCWNMQECLTGRKWTGKSPSGWNMYNVVRFNSAYKAANKTQARYRVLLGSAGSGKSVNAAQDFILKLSSAEYAGCSLLVVRSAECTHMNSTFSELLGAINRMGLLGQWK